MKIIIGLLITAIASAWEYQGHLIIAKRAEDILKQENP